MSVTCKLSDCSTHAPWDGLSFICSRVPMVGEYLEWDSFRIRVTSVLHCQKDPIFDAELDVSR